MRRSVCIFFISLLSGQFFNAQSLPLRFQGHVTEDRNALSGVSLQISKSGRVLNNILTDANGNYAFELPMGGEFMITVSKDNYVSKKFSVSTMGVPAEKATTKFPIVEASLSLFKRVEGVDYSLLNQPLNKYYYNVEQDNFEYDENHLRQMLKGLEQIKEQEKALKANAKEKEEAYQSAVKLGDKAFQKKEWPAALSAYQQALGIKPGEAYPTAQIAKVNTGMLEESNGKKASDEAAAKALAEKQAREKAEADALAKKKADEVAAKKVQEDEIAKAQAATLAKNKAEEEAAAKKKAEEAAALAKSAKETKEKQEAEALAKKKADEAAALKTADAAAKKAADELAAKTAAEKQTREKSEADALAKKKAGDEAAARSLADKQAREKAEADALAKKKAEDAAAKALAEKQAREKEEADKKRNQETVLADAKTDKNILPVLGATQTDNSYSQAIKRADEAFSKKRYYDAKQAYEEALVAKSGDVYAKTRLIECEKHLNSDASQNVDDKQKQLLAKYPPGITEEIITAQDVLIIRRILVKDKRAFVYEKKVFNWGGIACFRDGESITELTFEQETRKEK